MSTRIQRTFSAVMRMLLFAGVAAGLANAQSTSLDSGAWPTIGHDDQRTNRSAFQGPSSPAVPVLLYDAGTPVNLGYITVTSDGKILLSSCSQELIALDVSGKSLSSPWPYTLMPTAYPGSPETSWGGVTVSADGTIYVAAHECPDIPGGVPAHFYSIEANGSTTPNWPVSSRAMYWAPAISSTGTIFQMDEYNIINAYSPSGSLLWAQGVPSFGQGVIALDSSDNLYVGTDSNLFGGHTVYSFTSTGGARSGWPQDTGGSTAPTTPVIGSDSGIFIANTNGTLYGFNSTGSPRPGFPFVTGSAAASQRPVAISPSGTIYLKTSAGLYAINPDGSPAWNAPFAPGGDATLSPSPVVDTTGNIYVAFGSQVYSLDVNGTLRSGWPATIPNAGDMVIAGDGLLYVVSSGQQLYRIAELSPAFLDFPLKNRTAHNAKIVSVFDHSSNYQYCADSVVEVYDGEIGMLAFGKDRRPTNPFCALTGKYNLAYGFKQSMGVVFSLNGQYAGDGDPTYLQYDGHPGYDFETIDQSTDGKIPVLAAADGKVVCTNVPKGCSGATVDPCIEGPGEIKVKHSNGYFSIYLHLSATFVAAGDLVSAGQQIGTSGDTGVCGRPHLHFEIRRGKTDCASHEACVCNRTQTLDVNNCIPVDPYGWRGTGTDPYKHAGKSIFNETLWK